MVNIRCGEGNGTPLQYACLENPWTEEPGRLQSMGSQRVGHDWATSLSLFTFMHREGNGNPLQCSCLENPRDGRAWWAAVYGVAQSRTWLTWLSSSSSSINIRWASQVALVVKNLPANAGDVRNMGSIPGLGRSPGEHGNPLRYSCLENPMDRGAWQATYRPWGSKQLYMTEAT